MKHWKDIVLGLFISVAWVGCYGEEDAFKTPGIYKGYEPELKDGTTVAGYAPAPVTEAKYDSYLNELYLTWDGGNTGWEKREEYIGVEVEFNSLLSGKKIKRVMIPNTGDFGNLTVSRDYGLPSATLRLSKYRTVVVTDKYGVQALRFRSIYKDSEDNQKESDWVTLSDQLEKDEVEIDMNYSAWQHFRNSQANPVKIHFESNSEIRTVDYLIDKLGGGDKEKAVEEFRKWYYMDCATMSFDPYNIACDPYENLTFFIKKEQTGGAYAIDYPSHNEGRGIVYPASEHDMNDAWWRMPDMQVVMMHEMGHCLQWMPRQGHYIMEGVQDCDRQGYQEGWPDAVKISNGGAGFPLESQIQEYRAALEKAYENPQSDKYFVWQVDYNTSGAFMSWLRLYNGDFVRMLPWTVKMDALVNDWSLEFAVKYILKESYPNVTMRELWDEYKTEVQAFLDNN